MLKIGDFAKKNNITVRALHHYEEIRLLEPAKTDSFTGYRYYEEVQARDIGIINILKMLGFSLSEISQLLKMTVDKKKLILRLNEKYTQARVDLDRMRARSLGVERLMLVVKGMPDGKRINLKEMSDMSISDMMDMNPEMVFMENYERVLQKAKEEGKNITTMVMDIDRFDRINKRYGHNVGDAVLDAVFRSAIEQLSSHSVNPGIFWGKTYVIERKGGDNYVIRVEAEPKEGIKLAKKIGAAIEEISFDYLGIKEPITVSIGVANLDVEPLNADEFTHLAESALYLAKHDGRNRVRVYKDDTKEKLNIKPN